MKISDFQLDIVLIQLTMDELRDIIYGLKCIKPEDVAYSRVSKIIQELEPHWVSQSFTIDNG